MNDTEPAGSCPTFAHWLPPADVATNLGVEHLVVLGWITRGVRLERKRVRLPAVKLGGRWRVDPAAVGPFVQRMTANALGEGPDVPAVPEPASVGRRRVAESLARLRAAGVVGEPEARPAGRKPRGGRRRV
jgi:hypothetical protein